MPTKKKKVAQQSPEEKAESPRPVRHFVEVVEVIETEDGQKESSVVTEVPEVNEGVDEIPASQPDEHDEVSVEAAAPEEPTMKIRQPLEDVVSPEKEDVMPVSDEKRNEMVDELFADTPKHEEARSYEKEQPSVMPEITMHKKRSMMPLLMWAAIVIAVAALTGGGLFLATRGMGGIASIGAEPTPTPTAAPEPTPTPIAVARDEVTVEVQNGSGESGVANTMKALLEEKGYTVEKTGNADSYDYEQTEIHVKASKESLIETLKEDLGEKYTIGIAEADLDEDAPYDVRVIVGAE